MSDLNSAGVDADFIIQPTLGIFINTITVFCQITANVMSVGLLISKFDVELSMVMSKF